MNILTRGGAYQVLDKEAILDSVDIKVIAEEAGIPVKMVGRRYQILCPCHNDKHFGSCYLDLEKNTFRCYSCRAKGDAIDLVRAALNVGYNEALHFLAECCGGAEHFETNETHKRTDRRFIPKADQAFIGITSEPVYKAKSFSDSFDVIDDKDATKARAVYNPEGFIDGYIIEERVDSNPLYTLLKEDPATYRSLIDDFCMRTIGRYQNALSLFRRSEISDPVLERCVNTIKQRVPYYEIVDSFTANISKAEQISMRYGNGSAAKSTADSEKLSAIALSTWEQDEGAPF